jgi:hypothetical protein
LPPNLQKLLIQPSFDKKQKSNIHKINTVK